MMTTRPSIPSLSSSHRLGRLGGRPVSLSVALSLSLRTLHPRQFAIREPSLSIRVQPAKFRNGLSWRSLGNGAGAPATIMPLKAFDRLTAARACPVPGFFWRALNDQDSS